MFAYLLEKAVQETDNGAGQDTSADESEIAKAEPGGENRPHDGGEHDVRADGKVEHAHNHNEEKADRTGRNHQGRFKIAEKILGFAEIVRRDHFENCPGSDHQEYQNHVSQRFSG